MKNIWTGKTRRKISAPVFALFAVSAAALMAVIGLRSNPAADDGYTQQSLKQAVTQAAVLCYSAEGAYPDSIEYLEENYGIVIDHDKYIVHYSYSGGNIPPSVVVTAKS